MGKKNSKKGFNTPFKNLKLPQASEPNKKMESTSTSPKRETKTIADIDDTTSFAQMMSDITPIDEAKRIPPKLQSAPRQDHSQTIANEESMALDEFYSLLSPAESSSFVLTEIDEGQWEGRAPGVNRQLCTQLRRGEIPPRQEIDLHGLQKKEAYQLLKSFILQSRRDGETCVLVITGKGKNSVGGQAILKEAAPIWLSKPPFATHLLAFCPARPQDGGNGALYVLLRKLKK